MIKTRTSIDVPSNNENNTTITHPEQPTITPHSPVSSLTEKDSISGSTLKSKSSKQQHKNPTSTGKIRQQRQHNEEAAMAAQSAREASRLEDELANLKEQINVKKRAAEDARNQSNSRHKNLTQKRKREETNQQRTREDDDASVARQRRDQRHNTNKYTHGRGFNGGRAGRGRGRDGGRGGRSGKFQKN